MRSRAPTLVAVLLAALLLDTAVQAAKRSVHHSLDDYEPPKCAALLATERGAFELYERFERPLAAASGFILDVRVRPFEDTTVTSLWVELASRVPALQLHLNDASGVLEVTADTGASVQLEYRRQAIVHIRVELSDTLSVALWEEEKYWLAETALGTGGAASEQRGRSLGAWGVKKIKYPVLQRPLEDAFLEHVALSDLDGHVLYENDFVAPLEISPSVGKLYPCEAPIVDHVEPVAHDAEDPVLIIDGRNFGSDADELSIDMYVLEASNRLSDGGNVIWELGRRRAECEDIAILEEDRQLSCVVDSNMTPEERAASEFVVVVRRDGHESVWYYTHPVFVRGAIVQEGSSVPTSGGVLTLTGSFEVPGSLENVTVTVGGANCTLISLTATELNCSMPAGAGANLEVLVDYGTGNVVAPFAVSYDEPELTHHDTLPYDAKNVTVHGTSLGADESAVYAEVNGRPCLELVVAVPHTTLICVLPEDLTASTPSIRVAVTNQWSNELHLVFEDPPPPPGGMVYDAVGWRTTARPLLGGPLEIVSDDFIAFEGPTVFLNGIEAECANARKTAPNTIQCDVPPVWQLGEAVRDEMVITATVTFGLDVFGPSDPIPSEAVITSSGNVLWWVPHTGIGWDAAALFAKELEHAELGGGYLATPVSRQEHEFLVQQFARLEGWIGRVMDSTVDFRFEWYDGPHAGEAAVFTAEENPDTALPTPAFVQADGTWITAPRDQLVAGFFVQFGQCGNGVCDEEESCILCAADCSNCKTNGLEMSVWYEGGFDTPAWSKYLVRTATLEPALMRAVPHPAAWVQWEGYLQAPATATFVFELEIPARTHGGVSMHVNDELLVDGAEPESGATVFRSVSIALDRVHLQHVLLRFWTRSLDPAAPHFALRWAAVGADGALGPTATVEYDHLFVVKTPDTQPELTEVTSPFAESPARPVPVAFSQDRALSTRSVDAFEPERWYTRTVSCEWDAFDSSAEYHSAVTPQLRASCTAARYVPPVADESRVHVLWSTNDPAASAVPSPYVGDQGVLAPLLDRDGRTQVCVMEDHETGAGSEWTLFFAAADVTSVRVFGFNVYQGVQSANSSVLPWTGVTVRVLAYNATAAAYQEVGSAAWPSGEMLFELDVAVGWNTASVRVVVDDAGATFSVCLSELEVYEQRSDPLPSCECANDGTWGSVCGYWGECDNPWCYVDAACGAAQDVLESVARGNVTSLTERVVGARSGRVYKECTESASGATCDTALRIAQSGATFHASVRWQGDAAFAPAECAHSQAPLGHRGVWFRLVGAGQPVTLDTCALETEFSSYVTVYAPGREAHCDCLECARVEASERVLCGNIPYSSTRVSFVAQRDQWYYVFVSGGVTPFAAEVFEEGTGLVALNVDGVVRGWNDGRTYEETPSPFRDTASYFTPSLDLVCADGYEVTYTAGEEGPPCEVFEDNTDTCNGLRTPVCTDIDECAAGTHSCPSEFLCLNTAGAFECRCSGMYYPHPTDPRQCLVATEDFSAWEVLELRRRQQLANELAHEQKLSTDSTPTLDAELRNMQILNEQETVRQLQEHDIPRLTAWTMAAELYARYADAAVPPLPGLPNIGYLGRGYDLFAANPMSILGIDPGWRAQVLDMQYSVVRVSSDARFTLPDNVHAELAPSSQFESTSRVISSEDELREEMSKSNNVEYGASLDAGTANYRAMAEIAYSASDEFQQSSETLRTQETYFVQVTGRAVSYFAGLSDPAPDLVNPNFARLVSELDPDCVYRPGAKEPDCPVDSLAGYYELLDTFGTHYSSYVVFGGNAFERYEMSAYELQTLFDSTSTSSSSLSASAGVFSKPVKAKVFGSQQTSRTKSQHARSLTKSTNAARKEWYLGGEAAVGSSDSGSTDSLKRWAATVNNNPLPIEKRVSPITRVMTAKQFPDDEAIYDKQKFLNDILYEYCVRSGSDRCGEFLPLVEAPNDGIAFTDYIYLDHLVTAGVHGPGAGISTEDRTFRMLTAQDVKDSGEVFYPARMAKFNETSGEYTDSTGMVVENTRYQPVQLSEADEACYCDLSTATTTVTIEFHTDDDDTNSKADIVFTGFDGSMSTHTSRYKMDGRNKDTYLDTVMAYSGDWVRTGPLSSDPLRFKNIRWKLNKDGGGGTFKDWHITVDGVRCAIPNFGGRVDKGDSQDSGEFECAKDGSYQDPCSALYREPPYTAPASQCYDDCISVVSTPFDIGCVGFTSWFTGNGGSDPLCYNFKQSLSGNVNMKCVTRPPTPLSTTSSVVSSSAIGIEELGGEPGAYFRINSPIDLKNEVQSAVLYGSPFLITSRFGGMSVRADAIFGGEIMEAQAGLIVNQDDELQLVDEVKYYGFRLLPIDESRFGQPVRSGDFAIVQMIAGKYSISYDALDVVLLRPEGSTTGASAPSTPEYPTAVVAVTEAEVLDAANIWRISKVPNSRPDAFSVVSSAVRPSLRITSVETTTIASAGSVPHIISVTLDPPDSVQQSLQRVPLTESAFSFTAASNCTGSGVDIPVVVQAPPVFGSIVMIDPNVRNSTDMIDNGRYRLRVTFQRELRKGDCLYLTPNNVVSSEVPPSEPNPREALPSSFTVPYVGDFVERSVIYDNSTAANRTVTMLFQFPAPVVNLQNFNLRHDFDYVIEFSSGVDASPCTALRFTDRRENSLDLDTYLIAVAAGANPAPPGSVVTNLNDPVSAYVVECTVPLATTQLYVSFTETQYYAFHVSVPEFSDEVSRLRAAIANPVLLYDP